MSILSQFLTPYGRAQAFFRQSVASTGKREPGPPDEGRALNQPAPDRLTVRESLIPLPWHFLPWRFSLMSSLTNNRRLNNSVVIW